jgi:transcriptional regulator with XRE-family HTH domain
MGWPHHTTTRTMKITAITKFKHGFIFEALKKLNWTQAELARRCEVSPGRIGGIANLTKRPSEKLANTIQTVLGEQGIYLDPLTEWPETFKALPTPVVIEQTRELSELEISAYQQHYLQLEAPETVEDTERYNLIMETIDSLPAREKRVLELRLGLNGNKVHTPLECGKKFGLNRYTIDIAARRAAGMVREHIKDADDIDGSRIASFKKAKE